MISHIGCIYRVFHHRRHAILRYYTRRNAVFSSFHYLKPFFFWERFRIWMIFRIWKNLSTSNRMDLFEWDLECKSKNNGVELWFFDNHWEFNCMRWDNSMMTHSKVNIGLFEMVNSVFYLFIRWNILLYYLRKIHSKRKKMKYRVCHLEQRLNKTRIKSLLSNIHSSNVLNDSSKSRYLLSLWFLCFAPII